MTEYPPHLPTGAIGEVLPDIFFVTGQMTNGDGPSAMQFSRNMTIVPDGSDLTLLNTVRLDETGLAALDALGTVRNIVKLGAFHGRDDAFYLNRYDAAFWAVPGVEFSRGEEISHPLTAGDVGPCEGSSVFVFETASKPEAILRLDRHGGTLITCDSLQNLKGADAFFNDLATQRMEAGGFLIPANIGPGWRNATNPQPDDFARLKDLEFAHVLSGHGEPCLDSAKDQYSATFHRLFGV